MLTLKTYAHALREEEADLSFLAFDGPIRPSIVTAIPKGKRPPAKC